MSTQKYTLRKSKKYKNLVSVGLGLATVVAIGLATDNKAFASNEVVNNSTVESIKQNVEKTESKVVTKEEVSTAKLNLDNVKGQVKEQSGVVDSINKELSKVTKEKVDLEKLSNESTPENVEKVNNEIQNKNAEIKSENEKLSVLKGQEQKKQQEKQEAQQKLSEAKKELESAKSKTQEAEANLQNAKDILNGTNADKVIKALEEANKKLALAKENVVNKEKALEEAKKLDKERQYKIDNLTSEKDKLENQVSEQKQDLLLKTQEAEATQKVLEEAKKELVKAQNDVDSINNIVLSDEYVQALKTYMDYSLPESTRDKAKEVLKSENEKLLKLNTYKKNKNDDDTLLDVNNLSDEVRKELSLFASDLVNQIRKQFGTKNTVVTSSAIDFAKKVADEYVKDKFDYAKQNSHNVEAIKKVAKEYGLPEGQFYENIGGSTSITGFLTYSSLKERVYKSIVDFMLNGDEWLHAQSIAGINYGRVENSYLGLSFSRVGNVNAVHFITVGKSKLESSEKVGVHTISDGTVESVGYTGIGGNYVLIDMGNSKHAYYGHLREATVKQGDTVKKGDQIGILGNTGATTVYHVHFEVQENPPSLATKDSSPYLGKEVLNNGDIIRVSDKLETHVESSSNKNCNGVNGIDTELVGSDNAEKVWNFFKKQGFSAEATAGIMGNFQRESGMNPAITEIGNGIGFGLAQWSFERRTKLENWSKENNLDVASLTAQLNFTIEEMKNIQFGLKSFEDFKNIRDVSEATELFERYFERAGVVALAERLRFAEAFYRQYK